MKYLTVEMLSNAIERLPPVNSVEQRFYRVHSGFHIPAKSWDVHTAPDVPELHFIEFEKTPDGKEWCLVCQ